MRLLFITVASEDIGLGHLNRCLSIAAASNTEPGNFEFLVFGSGKIKAFLDAKGYRYTLLPINMLIEDSWHLSRFHANEFDVVLLDIVYGSFFHIGCRKHFFAEVRKIASLVAVIDSLGAGALAERYPEAPIDILIVPYAVSKLHQQYIDRVGKHQLVGAKYAILAAPYHALSARSVRERADRILVTCGGSDPIAMTPRILEELEKLEDVLDIRVVVGPLFDSELKCRVYELCTSSKHNICCLDSQRDLAEHMTWCDLAISASGLTKYELAATGTPTILYSIDEEHEIANRPFAELGTAVDMGAAPQPLLIVNKVLELLNNLPMREAMIESGLKLVDGKGVCRMMHEFEKGLLCKTKT